MATKANMGKFTDYIEKYDGENPSEYAQFKRDFEQTLTMLDVPVEKKYALFKACLTSSFSHRVLRLGGRQGTQVAA